MVQTIQNFLLLRRQVTVKVQIPIALARSNLATALSKEIALSGKFQLTRRYWGHLSKNHLKFRGPKANRQFCFLIEGDLSDGGSEALFKGKMSLSNEDVYQLLSAVVVLFGILVVMLQWGAMIAIPVFLGFIYMMVQWHFQFYAQEITQLLADLMAGKEPQPLLFSNRDPQHN